MQLMLPQMMKDDVYRYVYQKHCDDPDQFVILDNGAAEGVSFPLADLMHMAKAYGVDEVVLPDVIGDAEATRYKAQGAFLRLPWLHESDLRLQYVVQGSTFDEFADEIEWAAFHSRIDTIGIPRHAVSTLNAEDARFELALQAFEVNPVKPVHLLGGSPVFPAEIGAYDWPKNVRSHDTSSPFNYAFNQTKLRSGDFIRRPTKYFSLEWSAFDEECLKENVRDLLGWTSDDV